MFTITAATLPRRGGVFRVMPKWVADDWFALRRDRLANIGDFADGKTVKARFPHLSNVGDWRSNHLVTDKLPTATVSETTGMKFVKTDWMLDIGRDRRSYTRIFAQAGKPDRAARLMMVWERLVKTFKLDALFACELQVQGSWVFGFFVNDAEDPTLLIATVGFADFAGALRAPTRLAGLPTMTSPPPILGRSHHIFDQLPMRAIHLDEDV